MTELFDRYSPEILVVAGVAAIVLGAVVPELPSIWTATGIWIAAMGTISVGVGIALRVYTIRQSEVNSNA